MNTPRAHSSSSSSQYTPSRRAQGWRAISRQHVARPARPVATRKSKLTARRLVITFVPTSSGPCNRSWAYLWSASHASARFFAASSDGKGDASVVILPSTSRASHQPSSSPPIRYSRLSLQACSIGLNEAATEPVSFVTTNDQRPSVSVVHVNVAGGGWWGCRGGAGSIPGGGPVPSGRGN
jgi:hypothetical protein